MWGGCRGCRQGAALGMDWVAGRRQAALIRSARVAADSRGGVGSDCGGWRMAVT